MMQLASTVRIIPIILAINYLSLITDFFRLKKLQTVVAWCCRNTSNWKSHPINTQTTKMLVKIIVACQTWQFTIISFDDYMLILRTWTTKRFLKNLQFIYEFMFLCLWKQTSVFNIWSGHRSLSAVLEVA